MHIFLTNVFVCSFIFLSFFLINVNILSELFFCFVYPRVLDIICSSCISNVGWSAFFMIFFCLLCGPYFLYKIKLLDLEIYSCANWKTTTTYSETVKKQKRRKKVRLEMDKQIKLNKKFK